MRILLILIIWACSGLSFSNTIKFPEDFFFGVANAPGQVEDQLDDIWLEWAQKGKIHAFGPFERATKKLSFWSHPEIEIDLAARANVSVFRMGVDWGRIMPSPDQFDEHTIEHYRKIIKSIKQRNMKVMMTIMHHSIPKWAQKDGGWLNDEIKNHFSKFAQRIFMEYKSDVDWWTTFNEGNIFVMLAYTVGMWPPGETRSITSLLALGPFRGDTVKAMDRMADAHNDFYKWAKEKDSTAKIGLAHNMAYYTGKNWTDKIQAHFASELMNWRFPERIRNHMDFFGFNYYGAEWMKGDSVDIDPMEEYSEAGRAIYPQGLYEILKEINEKFKGIPIIITENGIGDSTDILRPAFISEHLIAVHKALQANIPVKGYILWTLTDNLEWSDGYCPKFGLIETDPASPLIRIPRPSFEFFKKIASSKHLSFDDREMAWKLVQSNVGKNRPFCRADDGINGLDRPVDRKFVPTDWRIKNGPGAY